MQAVRRRQRARAQRCRHARASSAARPQRDNDVAQLRARLGIGDAHPVIVSFGGIEPRKNTLRLLDAFVALQQARAERALGGRGGRQHPRSQRVPRRVRAQVGARTAPKSSVPWCAPACSATRRSPPATRWPTWWPRPRCARALGCARSRRWPRACPWWRADRAPFTEYLDEDCAILVDPENTDELASALRRALSYEGRAERVQSGLERARRFRWSNVALEHQRLYDAAHRAWPRCQAETGGGGTRARPERVSRAFSRAVAALSFGARVGYLAGMHARKATVRESERADSESRLCALLGPTNTGKTHRAIERMLEFDARRDGAAAAPARARGVRPREHARGRASGGAGHGRRKARPGAAALLDLHHRGDAARAARRAACGLRRGRRDPAGRAPRARSRVHRSPAARARPRRDLVHGLEHGRRPWCARSCPRLRVTQLPRLSQLDAHGTELAAHAAATQRRRRVQHARGVRAGRCAAPSARRRGGGARRALAARAQRAGRALPGRRGRLLGGHRRHRHGPQPRHRSRRARGHVQVRRLRDASARERRAGADCGSRRSLPARRDLRHARRPSPSSARGLVQQLEQHRFPAQRFAVLPQRRARLRECLVAARELGATSAAGQHATCCARRPTPTTSTCCAALPSCPSSPRPRSTKRACARCGTCAACPTTKSACPSIRSSSCCRCIVSSRTTATSRRTTSKSACAGSSATKATSTC